MIARQLRAIAAGLVFGWLAAPASASRAAEPIARLHLEIYRKGVAARIEIGGRQRLFQLDTAGGQHSEHPLPDASVAPAAEMPMHRFPLP